MNRAYVAHSCSNAGVYALTFLPDFTASLKPYFTAIRLKEGVVPSMYSIYVYMFPCIPRLMRMVSFSRNVFGLLSCVHPFVINIPLMFFSF